ncbi:MAG TPA: hypothetical protein VFK04_11725 [Gemmatimonadaceae bacterium]|jgi:hypothetical protein|nr:hypothetical protein [Gemmatimonadaceae bacterium]
MKPIDALKVVLVLVALVIWAYGIRTNQNGAMLVGVIFVLAAFLLRFVPKGKER